MYGCNLFTQGASVIRMMWFFLGNGTFQRGMKKYLGENIYSNVAHDDLWIALTNQSLADGKTIDVKVIMDTWIKQMNYPVVNVSIESDGNILTKQSRFVINQGNRNHTETESELGYMWEIPFTYTTSVEKNFDKNDKDVEWIHLNESEKMIRSSIVTNDADFWIIGNIQQYGYYRVNYDQRNWKALTNQLNKNHTVIHLVNRAQMINDAWALVKAGMLGIRTALDLLSYLRQEEDYIPWYSAVKELEYVDDMLSYTALYGQYQSLITEEACKHGITACVVQAKSKFQRWIENPEINKLAPDIKETVLCTAIKESDYTVWNSVYNYYKTSPASEQSLLIRVLGCSKEPWIIRRYLGFSMDTNIIRKQDTHLVIRAVSANIYGRSIAWEFLQDNWLALLNYGIGPRRVGQLLVDTTRRFNTEHVNSLRAKYSNFERELSPYFNQAIETVGNNWNWISNNYNQIEDWLITHREI
ncbi:hypothetical protein KUTeg_007530 [Tegillarca granosa]|uniref:Aminopeptidase N n=1 Tax=Tegillarca granosa TaxID=220873 RepID=A0ABQ9FDI9_TEGGR|nr:hypothetical protein KUTeg_007530 [Tegillarca granosa]